MPSAAGDRQLRLGKYRVIEHVAAGGMAAVYKAVDESTGQLVALKVLPPDLAAREEARERFRQEAAMGQRLQHEHIVTLYEFGEAQGTFFLAMEFVDGITLQQHIDQRGPLRPALAQALALQIVSALDHAHQLDIIHRDIKPANILLTEIDGKTIAKIADLGLSRETNDDQFRLTREGHTVGTVDYMAPEQARDSRAADIRSDLYSLGCTLFHALTGRPPFNEGSLVERLMAHAEREPPQLRGLAPYVPEPLADVVHRLLAKRPHERFQTPAELWLALSQDERLPQADAPTVTIPTRVPQDTVPAAEVATAMAPAPPVELDELGLPEDRSPASPEQRRLAQGQFELAKKYFRAKEVKRGLKTIAAAIRLDPIHVGHRAFLRDLVRATEGQTRGVRLPALTVLWRRGQLGIARLMKRHWEVLDHGEQALINAPDDVALHLALADAARLLHCRRLAWWLLQQALACADTLEVHQAIARYLEQIGQISAAIHHWEKAERGGDVQAKNRIRNLAARETIAKGQLRERVGDMEEQLEEMP